ncbi:MAG: hypothetical protein HC786_21015 [Richelia sp. CSU_2_1]|nr:hypothetical protein [Microcoleus sp. SU_5_6]NJR24455.1 hypothetical protein [Richelia sp. CSU_2_1]
MRHKLSPKCFAPTEIDRVENLLRRCLIITVNCQLSTVNSQLSTKRAGTGAPPLPVNSQLSTLNILNCSVSMRFA